MACATVNKMVQFLIFIDNTVCVRTCVVLFTATKNADQPLAVWRMVQKFAFEQNGVAAQTTQNEAKILIYTSVILSATVLWLLGGNAA